MTVTASGLGPLGPVVGRGGQAHVHSLPRHPTLLVKRYRSEVEVDPDGLSDLVAWPATLAQRERRFLDVTAAWPLEAVRFREGWGVLLRRAPATFMHVVEGDSVPRSLEFAYSEAARFTGVDPVTPRTAATIAFRVAQVLDLVHRNGVVYGDLSATNVFWSGGRRPRVFVIDCDSAWWTAGRRPLAAVQTRFWDDPWPDDGSAAGGRRRDLYKLALLFVRLYYHSPVAISGEDRQVELPATPPLSREARDLLQRGLQRDGVRPSAAEWLVVLDRLERALRLRGGR